MNYYDPIAAYLGEWSQTLNTGSVLLRIGIVVLLASVIGCERSSKRHSAGLRTFVLVSFASTVSMILDVYLMSTFSSRLPVISCATVIAAALISGNSILFSSRSQIKGLTTSAGDQADECSQKTVSLLFVDIDHPSIYLFLICKDRIFHRTI